MKTCKLCGTDKAESEFYRSTRTKDGLRGSCKACLGDQTKRWSRTNKEKRAAIAARYRKNHAEALSQRWHRYAETNSVELKKYQARYRALNREVLRLGNREWLSKNRALAKEASQRWKNANRERAMALSRQSAATWKANNKAKARAHEAGPSAFQGGMRAALRVQPANT